MKKTACFLTLIALIGILDCSSQILLGAAQEEKNRPIQAVPIADVDITDSFWAPRIETNRKITIPYNLMKFSERGSFSSKDIEAAINSLAKHPDPVLEQQIDELIGKFVASRQTAGGDIKWNTITLGSGHMYEAAVAHYLATGEKDFIDVAVRGADLLFRLYGPDKRSDVPEHQGIEVGLGKLFKATGDEKYLRMAKFLLDERGRVRGLFGRTLYGEYAQDHKPVVDQDEAVGHAVRAMFMYMGMADVALVNGDQGYLRALSKIWEDIVYKKLYITGSVGSRRMFEGFGDAYELPNLTTWNETCASFANVLWNYRLFLLSGEAKFVDIMERALYNGFLVGVSLSGNRFFYQNPLKSLGNFERSEWFGTACCPPNVARLLSSLGGYIYAAADQKLYVNLFIGSQARINVGKSAILLRQQTLYPWDGLVKIAVDPETPVNVPLFVRIPQWAQGKPLSGDLYRYAGQTDEKVIFKVNGRPVEFVVEKGFARIDRTWSKGDLIELSLPMPVRRVLAHEKVKEDRGLVALERGPIVYCAEWPDNGGKVLNLVVPDSAVLKAGYRKDLLNGVGVVTGNVTALSRGKDRVSIERKPHNLVAVPYYAWANRGQGEMAVWLAHEESKAHLPAEPTIASTSKIQASPILNPTQTGSTKPLGIENYAALNDQIEPVDSFDGSAGYLRIIPNEGSTAWLQYDFQSPSVVSVAEVYWLDDHRFCRLPQSWRILYRDGEEWKPVAHQVPYAVLKDTFNRVSFAPVKTDALRLEIEGAEQFYFDNQIGPPTGSRVKGGPLRWFEFGVIEWRVK